MLEILVVEVDAPAAGDVHVGNAKVEAHDPKVRHRAAARIASVDVPGAVEIASCRGAVDAIVEGEHRARTEDGACTDADDVRNRQLLALHIHAVSEGAQRPQLRTEAFAKLMAYLEEARTFYLWNHVVFQQETGLPESDGGPGKGDGGIVERIEALVAHHCREKF